LWRTRATSVRWTMERRRASTAVGGEPRRQVGGEPRRQVGWITLRRPHNQRAAAASYYSPHGMYYARRAPVQTPSPFDVVTALVTTCMCRGWGNWQGSSASPEVREERHGRRSTMCGELDSFWTDTTLFLFARLLRCFAPAPPDTLSPQGTPPRRSPCPVSTQTVCCPPAPSEAPSRTLVSVQQPGQRNREREREATSACV
jgi:hypothetical protein